MKDYNLEEAARQYRDEFLDKNNNDISKYDIEDIFIAGAEWQYEKFEKERLKHCEELTAEQAMRYLQEHHSPSEVSDFQAAMNIAVAKAIDSTINKSIEWLKSNICYDENGDGNMEWVVMFMGDDEMVENFKKFMED